MGALGSSCTWFDAHQSGDGEVAITSEHLSLGDLRGSGILVWMLQRGLVESANSSIPLEKLGVLFPYSCYIPYFASSIYFMQVSIPHFSASSIYFMQISIPHFSYVPYACMFVLIILACYVV